MRFLSPRPPSPRPSGWLDGVRRPRAGSSLSGIGATRSAIRHSAPSGYLQHSRAGRSGSPTLLFGTISQFSTCDAPATSTRSRSFQITSTTRIRSDFCFEPNGVCWAGTILQIAAEFATVVRPDRRKCRRRRPGRSRDCSHAVVSLVRASAPPSVAERGERLFRGT